jgi:hypothetical protein
LLLSCGRLASDEAGKAAALVSLMTVICSKPTPLHTGQLHTPP